MVNNLINISRHDGALPAASDSRNIRGGALYPIADVRQLLATDGQNVTLWTESSRTDAQRLCLTTEYVAELVRLALSRGTYKGSEWCEQGTRPGPVAACDVYTVTRMEWNQYAFKELPCEYYLKFAISKTGKLLLIVSCHESRNRR